MGLGVKMDFGDYVVYVDESGDPTMAGINDKYPIFVLAFCVFKKDDYTANIVKNVQNLKFKYFGHDMVIFHEREILKSTGIFSGFNKITQNNLLNDLSMLIDNSEFKIITCIIDKNKLNQFNEITQNPYHIALKIGLENLYQFLKENNEINKLTHIIFEQRGLKEDKALQLEFEQICNGDNCHNVHYPFKSILASKKVNSTGLQFADLIARPLGNHYLKPNQPNRAFDILKHKIYHKITTFPN